MKKIFLSLTIFVFLMTACNGNGITGTLPPPPVTVISVPDPQVVAENYLKYWQDDNYSGMYALLTGISQDAITPEDFEKIYQDAAFNLTLRNLDFAVTSILKNPGSASVQYIVDFPYQPVG